MTSLYDFMDASVQLLLDFSFSFSFAARASSSFENGFQARAKNANAASFGSLVTLFSPVGVGAVDRGCESGCDSDSSVSVGMGIFAAAACRALNFENNQM